MKNVADNNTETFKSMKILHASKEKRNINNVNIVEITKIIL